MMHDRSIAELIAAVRSGETTPRALTDHYLDRIERLQPSLNALITRTAEAAHAVADGLDEQSPGALAGLPILHKLLHARRIFDADDSADGAVCP